jgi:predicted DNA binding CopG/RHH family protein
MVVDFSRGSVNEEESIDGNPPQNREIIVKRNAAKSNNESITFRIYSDAVTRLRKEANEKDISFNTLVNQILKNHVEWHCVAANAGFISVRRGFVKTIIDRLSNDEVKALAEHIAKTTNHDILMIFENKINTESAIDFLEAWLRASGFPYRYQLKEDNTHSFVIQHDMGSKWALYLGELFRHLFAECKANKFAYDARESTLSLLLEGQIKGKNN